MASRRRRRGRLAGREHKGHLDQAHALLDGALEIGPCHPAVVRAYAEATGHLAFVACGWQSLSPRQRDRLTSAGKKMRRVEAGLTSCLRKR